MKRDFKSNGYVSSIFLRNFAQILAFSKYNRFDVFIIYNEKGFFFEGIMFETFGTDCGFE